VIKNVFLEMIVEKTPPILYAYIDPGTGSMLFTVLIGAVSVFLYGIKGLFIKLRSSVGRSVENSDRYPFVIYTDSKRYWNVFRPICEEFEKRRESIVYLTQSEDDPVFNEKFRYVLPKYIGSGNKAFALLNFLKADVVLSSTPSLDVFQWKRSKDVMYYIHIPHACSDITLYRLFGIDYYDALLLSGDFQIKQVRKLEELRNLPQKDLKVVGLTYFDEMKKRLSLTEIVKNKVPIVLVAPTWGKNSILNRFGDRIIDSLKETGYKIIIRPHPQSLLSEKKVIDDLMKHNPDIEWNFDTDNFDVLNRSDIMISDYSGVIFDFALVFNKPVMYASIDFDDSPYDAHWLNEPIWTFSVLPEIGKELRDSDLNHLKTVIDDCLDNPKYIQAREKVISDSWNNIGGAAKAIAEYMIHKQKELAKVEKRNG